MSTILSISHNLFLTEVQRYDWYNGKEIQVVGVSLPIWCHEGITSEPAIEIFAIYDLKTSEYAFIKNKKNGYEILLPKEIEKISLDVWKCLTTQEKHEWNKRNEYQPCLKCLLNLKDNGSQHIAFNQFSKIKLPYNIKKTIHVTHCVEIKDIKELNESLIN